MEKKIGYLSKNKSKGITYIYLRKSEREKDLVKKKNLYSFGRMPQALEDMYTWREQPEKFPEKLKELGYNLEDLQEWILTLETKITSKGNPFNV